MRHLKTTLTTILAALVVVMGVDYVALAATGQPLLLGLDNDAD